VFHFEAARPPRAGPKMSFSWRGRGVEWNEGVYLKRIGVCLLIAVALLPFQNCTGAKFSSQSGPAPSESASTSTETYDGKPVFFNFDLDGSCGPGRNGLPQARFTLEVLNNQYLVTRGPCNENSGSAVLDGLAPGGQITLTSNTVIWANRDPRGLVAEGLVFQSASSALNLGLIFQLWDYTETNVPDEKIWLTFMLFRKANGLSSMVYNWSRTSLSTGQLLEPLVGSPEMPTDTQTGANSVTHTGHYFNAAGVETGQLILTANYLVPVPGSLAIAGTVNFPGPASASGIAVFEP